MKPRILLFASIVLLTALLAATAVCAPTVRGSGVAKQETRSLPAFTQIELNGSYALALTVDPNAADPVALTLNGDDNILPVITTEVANGRLVVSCKGSISTKLPLTIAAKVKDLSALQINGSGNVTVSGLSAKDLRLAIAGSGDIKADGSAEKLEVSISGSGDAKLAALKAAEAKVHIAGSGDVELTVERSLDVHIAGSGSVTYHGSPATVNQHVAGSGRVIKR
jgi:hypothetical protein